MTKRFPGDDSGTPVPRLGDAVVWGGIGVSVEGEVCQVTASGRFGTWSCDRPDGHDDGARDALHHDSPSDDLWRASRWTGHPLVIDKAKRRARLARILRMTD